MSNFTESEIEALRLIHRESIKWGEELLNKVKMGEVDPNRVVALELPIRTELDFSKFSQTTKTLMVMGSEKAAVVLNGTVVAAGIYTGGNSAIQYTVTQNRTAKQCYLLSVAFSMSAIANGGIAVLSRACKLSEVGVLSEALGAGFMWCGNASQAAALKADGKPIPPELRKSIRRPIAFLNPSNKNGIAFAVPRYCDDIPFRRIGQVIGIGFIIYGYSKLVVASYRSAKQLINNYRAKRKSRLFRKKIQFLVSKLTLLHRSSTSYKVSS